MMLDAITLEDRRRTVVAMDGTRNGDRALRHENAIALIRGNLEMICHGMKLPRSHVEHRPRVEGA